MLTNGTKVVAEKHCSALAVNDCIDSADGENELAPFRNIMNEMYARDISRKTRSSHRIRGNAGEPLSPSPFGYMRFPDNPKKWIIDKEAADVVKNYGVDGGYVYTLALKDNKKIKAPPTTGTSQSEPFQNVGNASVDVILSQNSKKSSDKTKGIGKGRQQKLVIHYRFAGTLELPFQLKIMLPLKRDKA